MTFAAHSGVAGAIGWHGKLPSVGDFATRRLDPGFVSVWDDWISRGLDLLRSGNPEHWQDAYLASPTWRFALTPGFLPSPLHAEHWTGVVMPSVDRVGRYYPLTLAAPLRGFPMDMAGQAALWVWLQQLQDAAIDALEDDWPIDALDKELLRLGLPPANAPLAGTGAPRTAASHAVGNGKDLAPAIASMETFFANCAPDSTLYGRHGRCVWYSDADLSAPRIECCTRMDDALLRLWVSNPAGSSFVPFASGAP